MRCVQRVCFSPEWTAASGSVARICDLLSEGRDEDWPEGQRHVPPPQEKTQESTPKPVRAQ
jgi:hypothetical protein